MKKLLLVISIVLCISCGEEKEKNTIQDIEDTTLQYKQDLKKASESGSHDEVQKIKDDFRTWQLNLPKKYVEKTNEIMGDAILLK